MIHRDNRYLTVQFNLMIHEKNGTEFQRFFERIMDKAYDDFKIIRPYGKLGDSGNDGYRKSCGVYYQAYSPNEPQIQQAKAASKLREDFQKLKDVWDVISKINEYYFVFNDKYKGSTIPVEKAISDLEKKNPSIKFDTFLAKQLEEVFFTLTETDMEDLGFSVSHTEAAKSAIKYLKNVETELDRENHSFASSMLEIIYDIIVMLDDDKLYLEYEILKGRCLQELENIKEAKLHYENIAAKFSNDPRAFLYLAEIHLLDRNFIKNRAYLEKAEKIDKDHWLLKQEELIRKMHAGEDVDITNIDEVKFPDDRRTKANLYRLYSMLLFESGDTTKAYRFIEIAINLNPDRLNNFIIRISFREKEIYTKRGTYDLNKLHSLLKDIEEIEEKFPIIRPRIEVMIKLKKIRIYHALRKYTEFLELMQASINLVFHCYFDTQIEQILIQLLPLANISTNDLQKLVSYIKNSTRTVSDDLLKLLIVQLACRDEFLKLSKEFFKDINNQKYVSFINDIEKEDLEKVLAFIHDDVMLALGLAQNLRSLPNLRKQIIERLPDDKDIQKDRLLLILNYEIDTRMITMRCFANI